MQQAGEVILFVDKNYVIKLEANNFHFHQLELDWTGTRTLKNI